MPSRNIIKLFNTDAYYHVYSRGAGGRSIFIDAADKRQFIKIVTRHLDPDDTTTNSSGVLYRKFDQDLELLCYCLMGNHFHLLFYQGDDPKALTNFMRSVLTAYTMYFNRRHKRSGPLFQSIYKASRISNDGYLLHISRYIHLNPRTWQTYHYSSLAHYLGTKSDTWIKPERILQLFEDGNYMAFLEDYEDHKAMLETIKYELADFARNNTYRG